MPEQRDITALLLKWNSGDQQALELLTPIVYDELLDLARSFMSREKPGHTLSATALVHEAYLKIADQRRVTWENRAHFFGAAANIMRRLLVDHAKRKLAAKRGGSVPKIAIENEFLGKEVDADQVLALDQALSRLSQFDSRKGQVVEMKFFGGMTMLEIAQALDTSDATVERDWKMARAWLIDALGGQPIP